MNPILDVPMFQFSFESNHILGTCLNMSDKHYGFKSGSPVVQVKSIHCIITPENSTPDICVKVQCCYCFEEHIHEPGIVDLSQCLIVPDGLGHRESLCIDASGSVYGYNISTVAWKLAGRKIIRCKQ